MTRRALDLLALVLVLIVGCGTPAPSALPSTPPAPSPSPTPTVTPSETATAAGPSASSSTTPASSCKPGCVPGAATFVAHGPRDGNSIALTFDDGFNVPACLSIVATLLAGGVAATFFPNGQYVRETPSFWHWVAAHGFPVGSHLTTHHDPTTLSTAQLGLNLVSDRRILDATLDGPSINVVRPPFGAYDRRVLTVAGAAGYPLMVGWDVDSRDQSGVAGVAAEIVNASSGTAGSIVLMHCGSPLTPLALPGIIDRYRGRGLSFVTIPRMFGLPGPTAGWAPPPNPDAWPVAQLASLDPGPSWNASPAIDRSGHLHVAYETPSGIVSGDDTSGSWQSAIVAAGTASTFVSRPSIALDAAGVTHLVYLSSTTAGTVLLYRRRAGDGSWSSPTSVAALSAPASTATIAVDRSGQPVIAYAQLGGPRPGVVLARPTTDGWSAMTVPTTDRSFLDPSIAIDGAGAIHIIERRNGYSAVDETTNASGAWRTVRLYGLPGSAVSFASFDPSGGLVLASQESYGQAVTLGIRSATGSLTWTPVTAAGDLSGLTIAPDGSPRVAFSRVAQPGGVSRIWLAAPPP